MVGDRQGSGGGAKNKNASNAHMNLQGKTSERAGGRMDPRIQTEIGKHLRAIYDDVINEPVPSKFTELLEQLERSTTRKE